MKVTEQLDCEELILARVQTVELKIPLSLLEKLTEPFGVIGLDGPTSVTVTVQVEL